MPTTLLRSAAIACAAVLTFALAACTASNSAPAAAGPDRADELGIALDKDAGPVNLFAGLASDQLVELVYDKLFAPSPYVDQVQPWLATTAREVTPSTWEVALRDDVKWQDGVPFTADDVVFSFRYMRDAPTGRYTHHVNDTPNIARVVEVDAHTVRFECDGNCPSLAFVTLADLPIVAEHIWKDVPPAQAKTVDTLPIGTGPYRLTAYSPTQGYTFTANPDYFAGTPTVATITMPIVTDQSATFTALQSGQIDATVRTVPPELVEQFQHTDNLTVVDDTKALNFPELKMNFTKAPMDIPQFRRALSDAVDKEQMLDVVALGQGTAAVKGYPNPNAPFANPNNSTPTDPGAAAATLDELGFRDTDGDGIREIDGRPLVLSIDVDSGLPQYVSAVNLAAEDLRKVGIGTEVRGMDAATLTAASAKKDYDLLMGSIGAHGVADPDQFIMSHRSGYLWATNLTWPDWDATYADWLRQTDHADQVRVMMDLQTIHNSAPTTIPLWYPNDHYVVANTFASWYDTPGYGIVTKWSFLPADVVQAAHSDKAGTVTVL